MSTVDDGNRGNATFLRTMRVVGHQLSVSLARSEEGAELQTAVRGRLGVELQQEEPEPLFSRGRWRLLLGIVRRSNDPVWLMH